MTNIPNWPTLGRAAASRIVKILAHHAGWRLTEVPADYGLPLAAFLENRQTALLVAVADRDLVHAAAAMEGSLLETRADGLIVSDEAEPWFPPFMAAGLWRSGTVRWYQPLVPWADADGAIWLVPAYEIAVDAGMPSFRLVARHLKPEPSPWRDRTDRFDGLRRASALMRGGDK